MTDQAIGAIRFTLFKHSREIFLSAMDDASIPHSCVVKFTVSRKRQALLKWSRH